MGDGAGERDVGRIDLGAAEDGVFPAELPREYRVVISAAAFDAIQAHAATDTSVELAGVLAGRLLSDAIGPFLVVERAIAGAATRRTTSRVTFTHETWQHIHSEMEARCPDLAIVGWYHTHPGFGVFLSDMDLFIQDNFFNLAHQVAFVLDPLSHERGLYVWKRGRCERQRRYWLGGELCYDLETTDGRSTPAPASLDAGGEAGTGQAEGPRPTARSPQSLSGLWLLVVVAAALAAFWLGSLAGRARAERAHVQADELRGLLVTGVLRDGLEADLTRVAEQVEAAYIDLQDGDQAEVQAVRDDLGAAHRELVRIRRAYGEGERLLRRLGQKVAPLPPAGAARD